MRKKASQGKNSKPPGRSKKGRDDSSSKGFQGRRGTKKNTESSRTVDRRSLRPSHLPPLPKGKKPEYVSSAEKGGKRSGGNRILTGSIAKHQKGFAHLSLRDPEFEDLFIPPHEAKQYFHGDRVKIEISRAGEVHSMKVVDHRFTEVVGTFSFLPTGRGSGTPRGIVVYQRRAAREEIPAVEVPSDVKDDDWVRATLDFQEGGRVSATIQEVYGPELPAIADLPMVAGEFSLVEGHSDEAVAQAQSKTLEIPGKDEEGRTDLRHLPFVTIDGETARDFDDAVYVEKKPDGFSLWVAIADVSHYVEAGSILDQEAYAKATSVYFPERAFHMLPAELSENLCSLKPNEPRLAFVCKMNFDSKGKSIQTELMEGIIESQRRATYTEIQEEWNERKKNPTELKKWMFTPHFELYKVLRKKRVERGSIDFEIPEPEIVVDELGEPTSLVIRPREDAHRLIEEFMIASNEAVSEWALERKWPFVFRIHEQPEEAALQRFAALAESVGFVIEEALGEGTEPKVLARIANEIQEHPAEIMLNTTLLRSMKQARYDAFHEGHYGLASRAYSHFTSPIRRYPDLIVHRLLRRILRADGTPLTEAEEKTIQLQLTEQTEHCSYRERLAGSAEKESIRLKQVRIAKKHVGEEFEGRIVGMMDRGFFVQVSDPFFEGMVSRDSLGDDFYQFNEEKMMMLGRRSRQMFRLGDLVKVTVDSASLEVRRVDLGFVEMVKAMDPMPGFLEKARNKKKKRSGKGGDRHPSGGRSKKSRSDDKGHGGGGGDRPLKKKRKKGGKASKRSTPKGHK